MGSFLKTPFYLGKLRLKSNIFCSPLAGCSDFPFRQMLLEYQPGLMFCEMVKMDALIRHDPNTYRLLDYSHQMHPIGAQLCGSKPKMAAACARIIEDLGFDVVDLNCGCPVDKVTKDMSGSGMLKVPDLIGETLSNMVAAVKIPVTVKIRAGWDEMSLNAPQVTQIAEQAGAVAIFVHGRTRAQGYKGPSNRAHIKACKAKADKILVFGNGDLFDSESAFDMFTETGCDGVLLSRGLFGSPWLIEKVRRRLAGENPLEISKEEVEAHFLQHLAKIEKYQNPRKQMLDRRRIQSWYGKAKGKEDSSSCCDHEE